jgi:conjugative relaxase-like TrwC/TraI family protein
MGKFLMISHMKLSSRSGGAKAVSEYLFAGEYYITEDDQEAGRVFFAGSAADELGLSDDMTRAEKRQAFQRMLMGFHPTEVNDDGSPKALVQNAGREGEAKLQKDEAGNILRTKDGEPKIKWTGTRVMAHDFTFTPSKAFALLCAKADETTRHQLEELLVEANTVAMDYIEAQAVTRTGSAEQGTLKTVKAKTTRLSVLHQQSREGDPNWHVHNAVLNIAADADGNNHVLETGGMMRVAKAADKIAQAHLAARIEQVLGIQTEQRAILDARGRPKPGEYTWGVVGISDAEMKTFSKRRGKIEEYRAEMAAAGVAVSANQAAMATRSEKDEDPIGVALKRWEREAQDLGYTTTLDELRETRTTQQRAPADWHNWDMTEWVAEFCAINKDPKKWSVDCIELAVAQTLGTATLADIRRTSAQIAKEHFTRLAGSTSETAGWDRQQDLLMPTRWLEAEEKIQAWAHESRADLSHAIDPALVEEACKAFEKREGYSLADEQRAALQHVVADSGRWATESGVAGAGKTTVARIAVDLWRDAGLRVIGVSTGQDATQKLQQDAKMDEAYNGAALLARLDNKITTLDKNTVLLVDEAGMMDVWQAERLLGHARNSGCKVLMQGDTRQLQSIGGSAPFAQVRDIVGGVELKETRRQQGADLEPTKALYTTTVAGSLQMDVPDQERGAAAVRSAAIFDKLIEQDRVRITATRGDAVAKMARDYAACPVPIEDRLALASTNEDRLAANIFIRQELRAQGTLTEPDKQVENADGATDLAVGDRIRITKRLDLSAKNAETPSGAWAAVDAKGKRLGRADLNNGLHGTVEFVAPEEIRAPDGQITEAHRITMRVSDDHPTLAGAQVSWRSDVGENWTHDYCVTTHASQGQTKLAVFCLGDPNSSNESNLVAYTRGKTSPEWADQGVKTFTLYADADTADVLKERALGTNRQSIAALDFIAERRAENEADEIRREAQERGEEPTVELIAHGVAPYRFDEQKSSSYFATVRDSTGKEKTLWGVGLERALAESQTQVGEQITLTVSGSTDVEINGVAAHKNHWVVTSPAQELEREQLADRVVAEGLERASRAGWDADDRDTILINRLAVAYAENGREPRYAVESLMQMCEEDAVGAQNGKTKAAQDKLVQAVDERIERAGGDRVAAKAWAASAYEKRIAPVRAQEQAAWAEWESQKHERGHVRTM